MDFLSLDYIQLTTRFRFFTTEQLSLVDTQNTINSIISACRQEIDVIVWGNLAIEGLLYLAASKIFESKIVEISMNQLILEQAATQQLNDRNLLSSVIQRLDIPGEYAVEYSPKLGATDSFGTGFDTNLKTAMNFNPYRQEYERLQRIVSEDFFIV